jgi:cyclopropane-fatty-acyl-phospholipid synthase
MPSSVHSVLEQPLAQLAHYELDRILGNSRNCEFQIRLWDGTTWGGGSQPRYTVVVNRPAALQAMLLDPSELSLGEAFINGDFDIEGNFEAAFEFCDHLLNQLPHARDHWVMEKLISMLPPSTRPKPKSANLSGQLHSTIRDRNAISYHYDHQAEFYKLWLDPRMVYSCAYFAAPDEDLARAQESKLDLICRKLRLRHGDRFLDIGCGWGGLVVYAAAQYGVHATGITISVPQAESAREAARQAGLLDRCRIEVCDYRDLEADQPYDKIASVGMCEHVGEALLPEYFRRAWQMLLPGGLFLNHGIAQAATYERPGPSFTDKYVFPDGELLPINQALCAAEASGFEVRDVENLREHYVLTLRNWVHRLEAHADDACRVTDETTYRSWRIYMYGAIHRFKTGRLSVFQTLLSKAANGNSGLPLTREHV